MTTSAMRKEIRLPPPAHRISRCRHNAYGRPRVFRVASQTVWNSLPDELTQRSGVWHWQFQTIFRNNPSQPVQVWPAH